MSLCLYDDKCPVCGREIYESVICKHKEHITISITSPERPMADVPTQTVNTYTTFNVHVECISKLDWSKIFRDAKKADEMLSGKAKQKESQNG